MMTVVPLTEKTIEAGTKLLLSPELLRYFMVMKAPVLVVEGTQGDIPRFYELGCY
jgi:hypothetical protein